MVAKQRTLPELSVVNIVATTELGQLVDLDALGNADGFQYDSTIYHCAYLKDEKTTGKVSIFATER